jgi:hypothetical protein
MRYVFLENFNRMPKFDIRIELTAAQLGTNYPECNER